MSQELEEQQKLTEELKARLESLEVERLRINEQISILEVKLVVQDLKEKVRVKTESLNQLRAKKRELEEKLNIPVTEEQLKIEPKQEAQTSRTHF